MIKKELYDKIIGDLRQTYLCKNSDYGDSFGLSIEKYGLISALTRISDKFNRLENIILSNKAYMIKSETLEDTLKDMANYCILTVIELNTPSTKLKEENDILKYENECQNTSLNKYNNELNNKNIEIEELQKSIEKTIDYYEDNLFKRDEYIYDLEQKIDVLNNELTEKNLKEF